MRWLVALLVAVLAAGPAAACSVENGYEIPTNFELVQKAKVIVLARVKSVPSGVDEKTFQKPQVTLEPVKFLKGSARPNQLALLGWQAPENFSGGIPTVTTLSQAHWSSGIGGCIRQFYEPGELVVAFFEENEKARKITGLNLFEIFDPFARVVETVDGPDDIWVRAVERYVGLLEGSAASLNERIKLAAAGLEKEGTPAAQAMAEDLKYHLTRTEPSSPVWVASSLPMVATAGQIGQTNTMLYCLPGTSPGIWTATKGPEQVELSTGGTIFAAQRQEPTKAEQKLLQLNAEGTLPSSVYRFTNPAALLAALPGVGGTVQVKADGKALAEGRPLDALLRWASQCKKLQRLPALTEEDLRPKPPALD
jgi:hypothetical protein